MACIPEIGSSLEDFRNACRLCFERSPQLTNLFQPPLPEPTLPVKIEHCLGIAVASNDFPATFVCSRCVSLLNQFYDYKQLCLAYDQIFRTTVLSQRAEPVAPDIAEVPVECEPPEDADEQEPQAPDMAEAAFNSEPLLSTLDIPEVTVKCEPPQDADEQEPLPEELYEVCIKEEPAVDDNEEQSSVSSPLANMLQGPPVEVGKRPTGETKPLTVQLILNNNRFRCTRIQPVGTMQWDCSEDDCTESYTSSRDGTLTRSRTSKPHTHPDHIDSTGLIHCVPGGRMEQYALEKASNKLVWGQNEWNLKPKGKRGERRADCCQIRCHKYVVIRGDFQELEEFNKHNHARSLVLIRIDELPLPESELNPWDVFCQMNPCRLPFGRAMELPLRMKLFYDWQQYRLSDCSWDGTSEWRCEATNCTRELTLTGVGKVTVRQHRHDPHVVKHGMFSGLYFYAMQASSGVKKIYFDGHCYNSSTIKDESAPWACTYSRSRCLAKLHIGLNYDTFVMKGQHVHEGFGTIIVPLKKKAIYLSADQPMLPLWLKMSDLQTSDPPEPSASIVTKQLPLPAELKKAPKKRGRVRKYGAGEKLDSSEQPPASEPVRMVYDGFRYTMCELFPDGTSYWRCWGARCKKSLHMAPNGSIYFKNESIEHTHQPVVSNISTVVLKGRNELFAVFEDNSANSLMMYRNAMWDVVPGDGCLFASCKESACSARFKIHGDYARFKYPSEPCVGHGPDDDLRFLIRRAKDALEDDPVLWPMYQQKYPLVLSDGTTHDQSRYCQLFVQGFRYTLQEMSWDGASVWRCALQKCNAKGQMTPNRRFYPPSHSHDKPEQLQGKIWNVKRNQEEWFFVHVTLKRTLATMYYNTYTYALRNEQKNIWTCFPGLCNASLRIAGDFEQVVEETEHSHDGVLAIVRGDETTEHEELFAPVKAGSRKRPLRSDSSSDGKNKRAEISLPNDSSKESPKLASILQLLVKKTNKPVEPGAKMNTNLYYYGGFTYSRVHEQQDGNSRLECTKFRCPGRVVFSPVDLSVQSVTDHAHPKHFDTWGTITDVGTGKQLLYIVASGTRKRNVTHFVCDGYRYHVEKKGTVLDAASEWNCGKCSVRITLSDALSTIEHSGTHDHEPADIILPFVEGQNPNEDPSNEPQPVNWNIDEVIWGQHRYTTPVHIRRLNRIKWMCVKRKDCKAYLHQHQDGTFDEVEPHDHEGPVECYGEARFDEFLKAKDRFAILKAYGARPPVRTLFFQNQKYYEHLPNQWTCVRKACNGRIHSSDDLELLQPIEGHCHQPLITAIKFQNEINCVPSK